MQTSSDTTSSAVQSQFPINTLGEETASTEVEQVEGESQVTEGTESEGGEEAAAQREQAAAEEARRYGWVPKDEWQSDPARWRSATDFLAVREQVQAFKADETAKLRAKVAALEQREQARLLAETEARERITSETLRSELRLARENQDWDKVDEITEKLLEHKVAKVAAPKPTQQTVDPEIVEEANLFKSQNAWVEKDKTLGSNFALELKNIVDLRLTNNFGEALKMAKERTMRMFPERFPRKGNGTRSALAETGGTTGGGNSTGRSWNDLKPFYRQAAERDIAKKMYTREEYLANCADDPAEYFRS